MRHLGVGCLCILVGSAAAVGETIVVPNFSFESPPVVRDEMNPFGALPFIDDWDETAVGPADEMDQNTGVFINTDPGSPDHITNLDLDRAAFLSSLIGNDVRQELTDTFEVGRSYQLTVAVGTSFTFPVDATEELEIALFYFDGGVEQVVASANVSGAAAGITTLTDVVVNAAVVASGDPWAGQPLGVLIRPSITDPDDTMGEGFWNVDFVRLEASDPVLAGDVDCNGIVDASDASAMADVLVGTDLDPCHVAAADIDGGVSPDAGDIQALIDILILP